MSDIGKGDWVECLNSLTLTIGGLYYVEDILDEEGDCDCHGTCSFGLILRNQPIETQYDGWCALNFRPIYRPKQQIIEALKAPPKRVKKRV